jgi:hypothetical protein
VRFEESLIQTEFVYIIGFEVLTAVIMKSTISWDITPCSPLSVNRRFGGTTSVKAGACHLLSCCFIADLIFSTLKIEAISSSETSVDSVVLFRICIDLKPLV